MHKQTTRRIHFDSIGHSSVNHYKYLGVVLDSELSDGKDIQEQQRYQYCAANTLRVSAQDLGGGKEPGPRAPTVFMCLAICSLRHMRVT